MVQPAELTHADQQQTLIELAEGLLDGSSMPVSDRKILQIPIAQLNTLGAAVSSLVPAFRTVTQQTTIHAEGLYTLANAAAGDMLKVAENGNRYGALKTAGGASKMAQFKPVDSVSVTTKTIAAFNPATILMAAALLSIEQELGRIEKVQERILSFLEIEKAAEIEADVEVLTGIITKYKYNWDNEHYVSGNHKMVLDIQRTARKNMIAYQKQVADILEKKQFFVTKQNVEQEYGELEKKFKYYRLALYTFSLSSYLEIMLSDNFKEEYIAGVRDEVLTMSENYRTLFEKCSQYLEKLGESAVDAAVLKGIGTAGKAMGILIGKVPLVKEGPVDELLQEGGAGIEKAGADMETDFVHRFASLSYSEACMFADKMDELIQIFNHTEQIAFDEKRIYLIGDK